ncbi:MAG: DNA-binding protein WhiA [Erysipelotrichaceae bacterium]|nr:DNA-binding protein WhiA [Erysipelotrichaceae bacterium]
MSFSTDVKSEISKVSMNEECSKAQLAAMLQLLSSLTISSSGLQLQVRADNPTIVKQIYRLVRQIYRVEVELSVIKKVKLKKNNTYVCKILTKAREILFDLGLWTEEGLQVYPSADRKIVYDESTDKAYLSGCFLAGGSVNDPAKPNYHLEIATNKKEHAAYIQKIMKRRYIPAKIIERRSQYVVYIKTADIIVDFLAAIGATDCSFEFADIKIQRDYVSSLYRVENCKIANEQKTITAGVKQSEMIEYLEEKLGGLDGLEEKIREVALLRKEFPESSLTELCATYEARYGIPISKSGIKHRINKLEELAEKYRRMDEKGENV